MQLAMKRDRGLVLLLIHKLAMLVLRVERIVWRRRSVVHDKGFFVFPGLVLLQSKLAIWMVLAMGLNLWLIRLGDGLALRSGLVLRWILRLVWLNFRLALF